MTRVVSRGVFSIRIRHSGIPDEEYTFYTLEDANEFMNQIILKRVKWKDATFTATD